jgi:hypothetical protein
MTGEPQRTISSTPVAAMPGRIGLPQRPLVGVLGQGQQAVADGVAGRLVAGHHQQDEEGGHLGAVSASPSMLVLTRAEVTSSVGLSRRVGQLGHEQVELLRRRHEGHHRVLALGDVLGVAGSKMTLDALNTVS